MKILIADDHPLYRDRLALDLEQQFPDTVIIQASNFSQAVKIIDEESSINFILLDLDMADVNWNEGIEFLQQKAPDIKIVALSTCEDVRKIRKILDLNIKGYISKHTENKTVKDALKNILNGGTYLPSVLSKTDAEITEIPHYKVKIKTLTNRQSQVLDLIAEGKSNKQIAYEMGVSEATVKLHINALLRSLNVNNRTQAVITAQKMGLI
jgi:DNA-binding NarL/FixJ family response regulator